MLKGLLNRFKRINSFKEESEIFDGEVILLSKIDKHMNFLLRDKLGYINKNISERITEINHKKDDVILTLRDLHKSKLMNRNIPEREVQIMEGNRENYIKRISHLVTNIDIPKNYLETHDYCIKFSQDLEQLNRDIQKNIFVLQHFFSNEIKDTNKALHDLEEKIIDIRVLLEKNGINYLKDIQKDIKIFVDNALKMKSFNNQIEAEKTEISVHQEKLDRLNERIKTITSGTDYRALEAFRQEKGAAENEIKNIISELNGKFSTLDTALKKYYYMYPEKKIIKAYLDEIRDAIMADIHLDILTILRDIKGAIERNELDLKDRKREQCLETIESLTQEYLKDMQSKILKLEDQKQRAQTKITHNSASLNMSEQQYWINATEDKIKYHNNNIEKLEKNVNSVNLANAEMMSKIRMDLEKLMDKHVELKDDLTEGILRGEMELKEKE
ncbi:MAG: hypothetical protein ACP5NW_03570 [Candidatus Woesearchaeota archaeon]